jgi:general secretion pathway protein G
MERNIVIGKLFKSRAKADGFTFIEMVIVIVMLSILLAIAVPIYMAQVRITREGVLKNNLAIMRERLDQYRADRNKYPNSLQELVDGGYLREIPEDPVSGVAEWDEVFSDYDPNEPDAQPGIEDVHSQSAEIGTDGRPYSEW